MKRKIVCLLVFSLLFTSCSKSTRVSKNLSKEADNFNVVRQLTVIDCIQGDIIFQMTGKISIETDVEASELVIISEDGDGTYRKHFVGLSDNVTYVVEQKEDQNVSGYKYTLNFNPKMWIPIEVKNLEEEDNK